MKFIALIMSIIVVALSMMPCCDVDDQISAEKTNIKNPTTSCPQQHDEDDCCKSCSPFYSCGRCTGFVPIDLVTLDFAIDRELVPTYLLADFRKELPQMARSIWQPPQLG